MKFLVFLVGAIGVVMGVQMLCAFIIGANGIAFASLLWFIPMLAVIGKIEQKEKAKKL